MAGGEGAGRSADDWSRQLRQQAARLEARAARIEQGARGERRTAGVLNPRSGDGWYVLHDLAVPDSRANIDHVVVTPAGVFVVDSKDWSGHITAGRDTIWVNRHPRTRELDTLAWEASVVAATLSGVLADRRVPVRAVISLTNAKPARPVLTARDVTAVAVGDLVQHLGSAPAILDPAQVEALAAAIDRRLGSRSGSASSIVRPDPLPPVPAAPPGGAQRRQPAGTSAPGPALPPWRPIPRRPPTYPAGRVTRHPAGRPAPKPGALRKAAAGIGVAFAALVALGMVGSALKHPGAATTGTAATVAGGSAPAAAATGTRPAVQASGVAVAAPAGVTWACPAPGRGWTAILAWPAGESPYTFTSAQIAPSPSGPWTPAASSRGPAPIQVTGMAGGTSEWVRAGTPTAMVESGQPVMEGRITAPAGC